MKKSSVIYILLLLATIVYSDFNFVLRACLAYGFLLPSMIKIKIGKIRNLYFIFLLTIPSIGLFLSSLRLDESLSYRSLLLWTAIVLTGVLINFCYNRLTFRENYKSALLLSFVMLLVVPIFRKFGEGNYIVLAIISYLAAGYYVLSRNEHKFLIPLLLLFVPYLIVHLVDATVSDSFPGFLLILPAYIISVVLILLYKLVLFRSSQKLLLSFVSILVILAILWPVQENYATWILSSLNPVTKNSRFKFITACDRTMKESSDKKISLFLFTSAYCGNCGKEYPYFSELAGKYSADTTIGFYSTFLCFREKDTLFYENLTRQSFEFKWSIAHDSKKIYEDLKLQGVPSLLIINENNEVLYNGYCRIRPWLFVNSPDKIIERYLEISK